MRVSGEWFRSTVLRQLQQAHSALILINDYDMHAEFEKLLYLIGCIVYIICARRWISHDRIVRGLSRGSHPEKVIDSINLLFWRRRRCHGSSDGRGDGRQ